ncbi:hypothetical protein LCGC14_1530170 [marine sediment metagenome]|uniref:Nucleotidyltransferase n=1 Tax=marine sediment metagenome TaxID=412755 RepID=A0A0F9IW10_9ZZZZ
MTNKRILKTVAGSRAYGLETPESDWDYHAVFVTPTVDILALGANPKGTTWNEGKEVDMQTWEIGQFLKLATKCNPTILETFVAPPVVGLVLGGYGYRLRNLLPAVLSKRYVLAAYLGYAHNQRAKLFNKPDDPTAAQPSERAWKFATQYIRVLIQGEYLLRTGELVVNVGLYPNLVQCPGGISSPRPLLIKIRRGEYSMGDVINIATILEERLEKAYDDTSLPNEADLESVNEFLIQVRKEFWT